jgi:cytochrome P450
LDRESTLKVRIRRADAAVATKLCLTHTGSHFLTTDHDLHRQRRKPLEPFFSRQGVMKLEPMIAETVARVNSRLEALKGTDVVVRLDHVSSAFSGDVIAQVCCEEYSELLGDPEFSPQWSAGHERFQPVESCAHVFLGSTCFRASFDPPLSSWAFHF